MKVRLANIADNQNLLALSRSAPMESNLAVNVERAPDYFQLANLQGDDARVFVAEQDGVIKGAVGCCLREVVLLGRRTLIGYIGGIKVAAEARKGLTSFRLMNAVADHLRTTPIEVAIVITMENNAAMAPILAGRLGMPPFHLLGQFNLNYIWPLFKPRVSAHYLIRPLREDDLEPLAHLFTGFFQNYALTVEWTPARLSALLKQPNFGPGNILIAEEDGRPVAALSFWDQLAFKQTIVAQYGGWLKTVASLLKSFKFLPAEGEPFNELNLRHLVYEDGKSLAARDLIRFLINEKRQQYRLFRFGFHQNSRLGTLLSGYPHLKVPLNCYLAFKNPDQNTSAIISALCQGQIWEDLSLH